MSLAGLHKLRLRCSYCIFFSLSGLELVTILQSLSYKRLLKMYRWQEWENDLLLPGGKERVGGGGATRMAQL